ncbi:MAG TPA: tectonin domain-containing protein [Bryobacteraceae bacterium]|nr:tectonin domain-containing protein [Bryobacteraceae bacterium]
MAGHVRPALARAQDEGAVAAAREMPRMTIRFATTAAQKADLLELLTAQQRQGSALFHRWLTPAQYADRFGVSRQDVQSIAAWLRNAGFTDVEIPPSRTSVSFSGSAGQVEAAFRTSIHAYLLDGETHIANATDPSIPKALAGVVESIGGLHDFSPKPQMGLRRGAAKPHYTGGDGENFLAPDDFATIYDLKSLYNGGIDGTGQKIAIVGQSDFAMADIQAFRTAAGLPQNNPHVVLAGKDPGTSAGNETEADIDLEWAGAIAKNATVIYVNSGNAFDSASYAIENNLAPVLSISYGACEAQFTAAEIASLTSVFEQANAQGITVITASGDAGAATCDAGATTATHGLAVDMPASSPYVTGVGGTMFSEDGWGYWTTGNNRAGGSALSYITEMAWNDTEEVGHLWSSGGGKSKLFSKPAWQTGEGVPNDGARDVPDVSLAASSEHDGYLICTQGSCVNGFLNSGSTVTVYGGTSFGSPTLAAMVALLNQWTGGSQGNINPRLYELAALSSSAFHDIWEGNNSVPCSAGSTDCPQFGSMGYTAGFGYDQVTGLGSLDAYHFVTEWGEQAPALLPAMPGFAVSVSSGADGSLWGIGASTAYSYNEQTQSWTTLNVSNVGQLSVGSSNATWALERSGSIYQWDSGSQTFVQTPGTLGQISVGMDGDAWGVNGSSVFHFNRNTQSWDSVAAELTQIAVGFDGAVWGINSTQQIYRYNPGSGAFESVPGSLASIYVGADGDAWGINVGGDTFHFNRRTQNWEEVPGAFWNSDIPSSISVGSGANVWAVDGNYTTYRYDVRTNRWDPVSGSYISISASADGGAWGVDMPNVYQLAAATRAMQGWHQVPGELVQISAASDGNVWGLNMWGQIYTFNPSLQSWAWVPGTLAQIAVAANGAVWGVNSSGSIYRYDYSKARWDPVSGKLARVGVADTGDVWGIDAGGSVYRFDAPAKSWTLIPGSLAQLSIGVDGAVWGLDAQSHVYWFNPEAGALTLMPGALSQISVGSSANVWGLDAQGSIYRFDTATQSWQSVPGQLAQICAAFDGSVWGVNSGDLIWRYNAGSGSWDEIPGTLHAISVSSDASVWGINSSSQTYYFQ